jgi:hypothetical protein
MNLVPGLCRAWLITTHPCRHLRLLADTLGFFIDSWQIFHLIMMAYRENTEVSTPAPAYTPRLQLTLSSGAYTNVLE